MVSICVLTILTSSHAAAYTQQYRWTPQPHPGGTGAEAPIPDSQVEQLAPCVDTNGHPDGITRSNALAVWAAYQGTPSQQSITVAAGTTAIPLEYNYAGVTCWNQPGSQEFRSNVYQVDAPSGTTVTNLQNFTGDLKFLNAYFPGCASYRGCYLRDTHNFTLRQAGGFTRSGLYSITIYLKQINHFADGHYECINAKNDPSTPKRVNGWGDIGSCPAVPARVDITVTVTPKNNSPVTGSLARVCSNASTITPTFDDDDGPTVAEIRMVQGSGETVIRSNIAQSDSGKLNVPVQTYVGYASKTFRLYVKNRPPESPVGSGSFEQHGEVTLGPCGSAGNNITCNGADTVPATVEPGAPFTIKAYYHYTGGSPPAATAKSITIFKDSQQVPVGAIGYRDDSSGNGSGTITLSATGIIVPSTGTYTVNWSATFGSAVSVACDGSAGHPNDHFDASFRPYLQAYGGDVIVGNGVPSVNADNTFSCTDKNDKAGIVSWNSEADSGYSGAGSQYGARALSDIFDFASSYTVPTSNAGRPVALSFANKAPASVSPLAGRFGGKSGLSTTCDKSILSDGATVINGNKNLSDLIAASSISGQNNFYVRGNVYIDHNIVYGNNASYGTVGSIPTFKLVVLGGNISIAPSVGQLDGTYYALPSSSGSGGNIYTCGTASGPITDNTNFQQCGTQLVLNGGLVAKQVKFLRSCGTLSQAASESGGTVFSSGGAPNCSAGNHAAEVINYDPESWLPVAGSAGTPGSYQAIQSLPPVL